MKYWSVILREPFRLFFPLGILFGIAGTGHWLVYGVGLSGAYSGYYHASLQIWLYMGSFVAGFLMTAIPRFASAPHAKTHEILVLLFCMFFIFICLTKQAWVIAGLGYIGWLITLFAFILRRFIQKSPGIHPPLEFVWIPIAFIHAISGTLLTVLSQSDLIAPKFLSVGLSMVQQGFLLSLVMGVGGFLGSRLMGIYELPNPEMFQKALSRRKYRLGAHLACGAILFLSFWFETWGSILRAVIVTISLGVMSQVLRRPKIHDLFRQLLSY